MKNSPDRRVVAAGFVLFAILFVRLAVFPLRQAADDYRDEAARLEAELAARVEHLLAASEKEQPLSALEDRRPVSVHLPAVETVVARLELSDKLRSVSPVSRELAPGIRADGFEFRFERLSLREAVLLLEAVQGLEGIYLDRFILDRDRGGRTVNARVRAVKPSRT